MTVAVHRPGWRRPRCRVFAVAVVAVVLLVLGTLGSAATPVLLTALALVLFAAVLVCLGSPWYGLLVAFSAAMLLPTPFAVRVGGVSLTVSQLLLFAVIAGWLAAWSRRDPALRWRKSPLDLPLVLVMVTLGLSTITNAALLTGHELAGAFQQMLVFFLDFILVMKITMSVLTSRDRVDRLLRYMAGMGTFVALLGIVEYLTGRNVFQFVPGLPRSTRDYINALAQAATL